MTSAAPEEPPKKKRRLPRLDDSFEEPKRPTDSPELHQGRKRAAPHVRGQWASHVYLELTPSSNLRKVLQQSLDAAVVESASSSEDAAAVHSLLPGVRASSTDPNDTLDEALHLSLSRPLMLLTNQREDLKKAVARIADRFRPFAARYASFGVLENDEKTRRFLGIEVGQGYAELEALVRKLDEAFAEMRLPAYYPEPRFHTSIAWTTTTSATATASPPFAEPTLEALETRFGPSLRKEGQVWVGELCVKIGKEIARYRLSGSGGIE